MCIPPLVDEKLEQDRATVDKVFEELSSHDNKIDKELFQQKVCFSYLHLTKDLWSLSKFVYTF